MCVGQGGSRSLWIVSHSLSRSVQMSTLALQAPSGPPPLVASQSPSHLEAQEGNWVFFPKEQGMIKACSSNIVMKELYSMLQNIYFFFPEINPILSYDLFLTLSRNTS